jgi:flagellar motor switch/type III secretory pathway protein FliN
MATPSELARVQDIPVDFEAVLPAPPLRVGALLDLGVGSVINTGRPAGETVEIYAAGASIGFAELADGEGRRAVRMVRFHPGVR